MRVGREIVHLAFFRALGKIVFLVAGNACNVEAFGITHPRLTIHIDHIVSSAFVVFLEHRHMQYIFPDEYLIGHFHHFHNAATGKGNDIVEGGHIHHKLILLQTGSYKTLFPVHI